MPAKKKTPTPTRGESRSAREALAYLQQKEMVVHGPSTEDQPLWPANLADLPSDDLSEHMTFWAAQKAYIGFELALFDVERRAFEAQAGHLWTMKYLKGGSDKVTDLRERANAEPAVVDARTKAMEFDARRRLLQALWDGSEAKYQACSREQSRREKQQERGL